MRLWFSLVLLILITLCSTNKADGTKCTKKYLARVASFLEEQTEDSDVFLSTELEDKLNKPGVLNVRKAVFFFESTRVGPAKVIVMDSGFYYFDEECVCYSGPVDAVAVREGIAYIDPTKLTRISDDVFEKFEVVKAAPHAAVILNKAIPTLPSSGLDLLESFKRELNSWIDRYEAEIEKINITSTMFRKLSEKLEEKYEEIDNYSDEMNIRFTVRERKLESIYETCKVMIIIMVVFAIAICGVAILMWSYIHLVIIHRSKDQQDARADFDTLKNEIKAAKNRVSDFGDDLISIGVRLEKIVASAADKDADWKGISARLNDLAVEIKKRGEPLKTTGDYDSGYEHCLRDIKVVSKGLTKQDLGSFRAKEPTESGLLGLSGLLFHLVDKIKPYDEKASKKLMIVSRDLSKIAASVKMAADAKVKHDRFSTRRDARGKFDKEKEKEKDKEKEDADEAEAFGSGDSDADEEEEPAKEGESF